MVLGEGSASGPEASSWQKESGNIQPYALQDLPDFPAVPMQRDARMRREAWEEENGGRGMLSTMIKMIFRKEGLFSKQARCRRSFCS